MTHHNKNKPVKVRLVDQHGDPQPRKLTVVIAIPSQDICPVGFAHDLARLTGYVGSTRPDITVYLVTSRGTIIPQQRTTLVKEAQGYGATHILWLDSDMRFPKDTLTRLLAHNEPIVGANYTTRRPPIIPTAAHTIAGLEFTTPESTGLVQVDRMGMGVMLVDMDVFTKLPAPWFALGYLPKIDDFVGEDVFFCQKATHGGYAVLVDHDLSKDVLHLGEFPYQYTHALQTRDAALAKAALDTPAVDTTAPADALSNYTELQASVADWLQRTDLSTQIPDFIQLAEAEIARRLRRCTIRTTISIVDRETDLPDDAVELRSIYLQTAEPYKDLPLNVVSPEMLAEARARRANVAYRPLFASMIAGKLVVAPDPDQSYTAEVIYFQSLIPLTGAPGTATNSILMAAPDIYLYGALLQAEPFLEHDDRAPLWKTKFDTAIDQMNDVRDREEYNASIRPIRLPIVFN